MVQYYEHDVKKGFLMNKVIMQKDKYKKPAYKKDKHLLSRNKFKQNTEKLILQPFKFLFFQFSILRFLFKRYLRLDLSERSHKLMDSLIDKIELNQQSQLPIIHSGLTFFPTFRHAFTIACLVLLQIEGIYICLPLNKNSNVSYLIGQIILLCLIFYSWRHVLSQRPGPMSKLFSQEFIKKLFQEQIEPQNEPRVCTDCQIYKVQKIFHCNHCNRCVYKHYFHSQWLNTCVAQQNLHFFMAFMVFLLIYFLLVGIDHILLFVNISAQSEQNLSSLLSDSFRNLLIFSFMVLNLFFAFSVFSVISIACFIAFRIKPTVEPYSCRPGCHGLKRKGANDKILSKIRQSIRESNLMMNQVEDDCQSGHQFFRETEDHSLGQLKRMSLRRKSTFGQKQTSSSQKQAKNPFKSDFFSSSKIFRKKLNPLQKGNNVQGNASNDDISKMTPDKWKKYVKSSFQNNAYKRGHSQLMDILESKIIDEVQQNISSEANQNYTIHQSQNEDKNQNQISNSGYIQDQKQDSNEEQKAWPRRDLTVRKSNIKQKNLKIRNILTSFAKQICVNTLNAQSKQNLPFKKIRFLKKNSNTGNLTSILQIQQKKSELQNKENQKLEQKGIKFKDEQKQGEKQNKVKNKMRVQFDCVLFFKSHSKHSQNPSLLQALVYLTYSLEMNF